MYYQQHIYFPTIQFELTSTCKEEKEKTKTCFPLKAKVNPSYGDQTTIITLRSGQYNALIYEIVVKLPRIGIDAFQVITAY